MTRVVREHKLIGDEQSRYLSQIDKFLGVLAQNLVFEKEADHFKTMEDFAKRKDWDWQRLPKFTNTYKTLSNMVQTVREEYQWLDWQTSKDDPSKNKGYFEEANINASSGLPWQFDFIALNKLKKSAPDKLKKLPSFTKLAQNLDRLLLQDDVEIGNVSGVAEDIHKQAMRINYLEQLKDATLLGWESSDLKPTITKLKSFAGETQFNISFVNYSLASGMFQAYTIDLWQDIRETHIEKDSNGEYQLTNQLRSALKFNSDSLAAWYVLKKIDEGFESLHPVHVSKSLIGPFETKYQTGSNEIPQLPITKELLEEDPEAGFLRFSRQYTYAPNHKTKGKELAQVIYREDWRDEMIITPAKYSSRVADSVLGTQIRIIEV